ncbi:fatty acid/sphingolipid desaturase [Gymnopus androsaceus JB14]|uniref:Delta 8-(E)-sphingolipid desaturase n=1 Tax=Gymnopus androsaceus JB14 TaxID=1447944 RepID=A0A6A4GLC8_9AGAR|nr:fatty acid/sphingolipid desaturase [Gymnopus androsaceus JB14]
MATLNSCTEPPTSNHATNLVPLDKLKEACTSKRAWVSVDGVIYDLTAFIPQHPGGQDFILFAAGKDVTKIFECYHGHRQHQILQKYKIGVLSGQDMPSFLPSDDFYSTLKKRVDDHFGSLRIDRKHSLASYVRYFFTVVCIWSLYWLQWSLPSNSLWMFYLLSIVHGALLAQYCVSAVHDGSHGAIGHNPALWKLLVIGHDFFNGCSGTLWTYQHVMSHHIYPNVDGFDADIETSEVEFRRIKESQKYFPFYRLQSIYSPFLYVLLGSAVRIEDLIHYFQRRRGPFKVNPFTPFQKVIFWGGKLFFFLTRIALPVFWGAPILRVISAFLLADFFFSIVLAVIFQATHVVDTAVFPRVNPTTGNIEVDWARLQVETAQDYSHDQPLTSFLSGSLNYQVVHHLFPAIAQEHLPGVARIVRQTAKEFGVKYEIKDSLWSAIGGHIGLLRMLGTPPSSH